MVNWTALLGLEQGVKARKTTGSWIVNVETLYGRSPGELVTLAKNLADRVAQGLMSKYGCVLGQGTVNKPHELGVDDPVAQLLNQYFTVSTPKRVIDDSPGEDEGEIDHLGRDAAVEYLLMPERIKKLEREMEEVSDKPNPDFDKEVQKALSELNAKSAFTEMAVYERLFGWAIIALTVVDYGDDPAKPVKNPSEILRCDWIDLKDNVLSIIVFSKTF